MDTNLDNLYNKVIIYTDTDCEMMQITKGNEVIFYGNYTDFSRDPSDMVVFLRKLGLNVDMEQWMYSV